MSHRWVVALLLFQKKKMLNVPMARRRVRSVGARRSVRRVGIDRRGRLAGLMSMAGGARGRHRTARISLTRIEGQAIAWGLSSHEGRPLVVRATHLRGHLGCEKVPVSLSRKAAHARAPPPASGESAPNAGDQAATPFRKMRGDLRAGRASAAHSMGKPSAGGFSSHHLARRGSNARARRRAWGCRSRVGTGGKGVRALRRYRARR